MAGTLLGPLIGGILPGLIGLRETFFLAGGGIFLAFLATVFLIHEDRQPRAKGAPRVTGSAWAMIPDRRPVVAVLSTAMLLMLANMSIEPIIRVYLALLACGVLLIPQAFRRHLAAHRLALSDGDLARRAAPGHRGHHPAQRAAGWGCGYHPRLQHLGPVRRAGAGATGGRVRGRPCRHGRRLPCNGPDPVRGAAFNWASSRQAGVPLATSVPKA
jgi:MFS family permease